MKTIAFYRHLSQSENINDNRYNQVDKLMKIYQPANYRITVEGHLDDSWSDCMGDMTISASRHAEQGTATTMVGRVKDQAELFGLLNTLYELHLPLLSVKKLPAG